MAENSERIVFKASLKLEESTLKALIIKGLKAEGYEGIKSSDITFGRTQPDRNESEHYFVNVSVELQPK